MERMITLPVWVGIITEGYGDLYVITTRTEEDVRNWVHSHVVENWDDDDVENMPEERDEAIDRFFEDSDENWFCYERDITMPIKDMHELMSKALGG